MEIKYNYKYNILRGGKILGKGANGTVITIDSVNISDRNNFLNHIKYNVL